MEASPNRIFLDKDEEESCFRIPLRDDNSLFAREVSKKTLSGESSTGRTSHADRLSIVLLVVHGGPGLADHTESFHGLKRALDHCQWERGGIDSMVFYDQLGCGRSDKPALTNGGSDDDNRYSLRSYVDELSQVIEFVAGRHPDRPMCLLGHSWGGQIVSEMMLLLSSRCRDHAAMVQECQKKSDDAVSAHVDEALDRICCAVISNAPLDEGTYERKQIEMRASLDEEMRRFLEEDEETKAADGSVGSMIYCKLIGVSETKISGEMKGWEVRSRLKELTHLCLFISGDDDSVPFEEYLGIEEGDGDCNCRGLVIKGGGHGPFYGSTAGEYFQAISVFIEETLSKHTTRCEINNKESQG